MSEIVRAIGTAFLYFTRSRHELGRVIMRISLALSRHVINAVFSDHRNYHEPEMLSEPTLEDQAVPISAILPAVAERIHYAEGRRTNFTVVAGALLAGGVAVLTFIPGKNLGKALEYMASSASIGSIGLGLLLLIVFARQTNRYPWTAATNTWKWFYRDALPDQKAFDPTWLDLFQARAEKKRLQAAFNQQLPIFESKMESLKDARTSFGQDVQQLYVLHINEKFKNVHLSQLRTILSRGVATVAVLSLALGAWGLYQDYQRKAVHIIQKNEGTTSLTAQWRFVSSSDKNGLILANVTVANSGPKAIPLPRWVLLDTRGGTVPAEVSSGTGSPTEVPAMTRMRYPIFIKPAEQADVEDLTVRLK